MKYKYIVDLISCWRKANGYTSWACRITSTITGRQVTGRIPHSSNLTMALSDYLGSLESVYITEHKFSLREFRTVTCEMGEVRDLDVFVRSVDKA